VLAALNIADEVFRLREEKSRAGDGLATRAAALAKELGAALGE
jgi:stalled ribosome alternative rescue factor ArfA